MSSLSMHRIETGAAVNLEPIRFEAPEGVAPMQVVADWTTGLPVFRGHRMTLRELAKSDAPSLLSML